MEYRLLPWILQQEGTDFQRIEKRWRPTNLLFVQQARALLKDMESRYKYITQAAQELGTLQRPNLYFKYIQRMRLWLRKANFVWKFDQLVFLQAVSSFYSDYGAVLRLLKIEQSRGRFTNPLVT